jgi:hypothetical protein
LESYREKNTSITGPEEDIRCIPKRDRCSAYLS